MSFLNICPVFYLVVIFFLIYLAVLSLWEYQILATGPQGSPYLVIILIYRDVNCLRGLPAPTFLFVGIPKVFCSIRC